MKPFPERPIPAEAGGGVAIGAGIGLVLATALQGDLAMGVVVGAALGLVVGLLGAGAAAASRRDAR